METSLFNVTNPELVPTIEFAQPPLEDDAKQYQPAIFYPDFMRSTLRCKETIESYPVILTDDKGQRYSSPFTSLCSYLERLPIVTSFCRSPIALRVTMISKLVVYKVRFLTL